MAKKISGSVGKGGKNKPEDTQAVQEMLNTFAKKCGFKQLDVDGLIGPKTLSAIAAFQSSAVGMARPDSRIDPRGDSFATLAKGPKKAEAEAKKAEKAEAAGKQDKASKGQDKASKGKGEDDGASNKEGEEGSPQVKGDTRGVDKKILAVLEAVSAHYGKPIVIKAGKQQDVGGGEQLWHEWLHSLDRGNGHPSLRRDAKLRQELDELYNQVKKKEFLDLVAKQSRKLKSDASGAHAAGRAVDVARNTDSKVLAALETILRREDEEGVVHFDDTGKNIPKTISEAMKKKWK